MNQYLFLIEFITGNYFRIRLYTKIKIIFDSFDRILNCVFKVSKIMLHIEI